MTNKKNISFSNIYSHSNQNFWLVNILMDMTQPFKLPDIIGHRGFCDVNPENTIVALEAAISAGACAIETDVQLSKDGEIVIAHDNRLGRTIDGKGYISKLNWYGELEHMRTNEFKGTPPQVIISILIYGT